MEIVLENPSVAPLSTRTPASATTATSQLGLPMHHPPPPPPPPHHFPHRATLYDAGVPLLPTEDYYARNRHGLTSSYDRDLDGASAPVTVRRIDKSGLLEIAEADPTICPRPRVLTGAEDVAARPSVSLRVDRSGLLEAVPEAVDQSEEYCNNDSVSFEHGTANTLTTTATVATVSTFDESEAAPREEMLSEADVTPPRVFDGMCCPLERPSSLEGQACPDEAGAKDHSMDIKVLTGSPRAQFDISTKATERLSHFSSFSPGPSLRHPRNDLSRGSSPLTSRYTDADLARSRNQNSPEFAAKYTPANTIPRNLASRQSQSFTSTSDYSSVPFLASPMMRTMPAASTTSPVMRGQRPQTGCSKDNLDPSCTDSDDPAMKVKAPRESLLTKGSAEQEDDELPGEERAEAEGCEHTAVEGLEEDEVSFKGSNKLLDNDNVQTLRVIILSEQL